MRRPDGRYALIDFNVAKRRGDQTEFGGFTRDYAAGEQMPEGYKEDLRQQGLRNIPREGDQPKAPTDERTDLYGLAATAYELLTGEKVVGHRLRRPGQLRPNEAIPIGLEATLLRMLAVRMGDRPPNAAAALDLLHSRAAALPPPDPAPFQEQTITVLDDPAAPAPLLMTEQTPPAEAGLALPLYSTDERSGKARITGIAWSPTSRQLAIGTACGIRLYDAAQRTEELFRLTSTPVRHLGFALEGGALAIALDNTVEVRRLQGDARPQVFRGYPEGDPGAVVFAPLARTLSVLADDSIRTYQIDSERERDIPLPPESDFDLSAASQDGQVLAIVFGDAVTLWRLGAEQVAPSALPTRALPGPAVALAITPKGNVVALASDSMVQWWLDGRAQLPLRVAPTVRCIALTPDGARIAVATDKGVQIYPLKGGLARSMLAARLDADLFEVAFDAGGETLAAASPGGIWVWDARSGQLIDELEYTATPRFLAFAPGGAQLASVGRSVQLWSLVNGSLTPAKPPLAHLDHPLGVAFAPRGDALAVASTTDIMLWKLQPKGGAPESTLRGGERRPAPRLLPGATAQSHGIMFAARGQNLLQVAHDAIQMWPMKGREGLARAVLEQQLAAACDVALAPDGSVAAVYADRRVRVWRSGRPEPYELLLGYDANSIVLAPDGRALAAVSDDAVQIWHLVHHAAFLSAEEPMYGAERVVFAPDGAMLATIKGKEIRIWRVEKNALIFICAARGHTDVVTDVAFSEDRHTFASVSHDGTLRLWAYQGG
jgi:WD40 repeat protein